MARKSLTYLCLEQETKDIYDKLREILGGQESVKLYLEFLKRNDKTDPLILKHSKASTLYRASTVPETNFDFSPGLAGGSFFHVPHSTYPPERFHACGDYR